MDELNNSASVVEGGAEGAAAEEVKTYTQEEVLALLQSETDKRVNQALAKHTSLPFLLVNIELQEQYSLLR